MFNNSNKENTRKTKQHSGR